MIMYAHLRPSKSFLYVLDPSVDITLSNTQRKEKKMKSNRF